MRSLDLSLPQQLFDECIAAKHEIIHVGSEAKASTHYKRYALVGRPWVTVEHQLWRNGGVPSATWLKVQWVDVHREDLRPNLSLRIGFRAEDGLICELMGSLRSPEDWALCKELIDAAHTAKKPTYIDPLNAPGRELHIVPAP